MTLAAKRRARGTGSPHPAAAVEFQRPIIWHRSAPRGIVTAFRDGSPDAAWEAWQQHMARRAGRLRPWWPLARGLGPLLWAVKDIPAAADCGPLVSLLHRSLSGKGRAMREAIGQLPTWLEATNGTEQGPAFALQCLAWCHALPRLAAHAPGWLWWSLLWRLIDAASESRGPWAPADSPAWAPLTWQIAGGELPLTLGLLLPEIEDCRQLRKQGRSQLRRGILELLQGEGLPPAEHLAVIRPLLACWTRCRVLERQCRKVFFDRRSRRELHRLLIQSLRWTRGDGGQFLGDASRGGPPSGSAENRPGSPRKSEEMFRIAARLDGSRRTRDLERAVFSRLKKWKRRRRWPHPASSGERSGIALLRGDWSARSAAFAVALNGGRQTVEAAVGPASLLAGHWEFAVRCDGRTVTTDASAAWEEVCWETNRRAQYVEFELPLGDSLRLERSVLLAVEDEFLLLADTVVGPSGREIEYAGRLSLPAGVCVTCEEETRELTLAVDDLVARAVPLALPEWRIDRRFGQLEAADGVLELTQRSPGGSLHAPLFVDLSKRRSSKSLTWRQLTVAEDQQPVGREVAVGYRVEVGDRQWLIYRAVSRRGNRSLLGQNLLTDFKVGRFDRDGEVRSLMEIE